MFKLGRPSAISSGCCPLVWPQYVFIRSLTYHRLDGKRVSRLHHPRRLAILEVKDVGCGVENLSHTVPAKLSHGGEALLGYILFDNCTDVFVRTPRLAELNCFLPRVVCNFDKPFPCLIDVPNTKGFRA